MLDLWEEYNNKGDKMILENKTSEFQQITLKDKSTILVNPYRTVVVPEGTDYNKEVFFETPIVREVVESKDKKTNTKGEL